MSLSDPVPLHNGGLKRVIQRLRYNGSEDVESAHTEVIGVLINGNREKAGRLRTSRKIRSVRGDAPKASMRWNSLMNKFYAWGEI